MIDNVLNNENHDMYDVIKYGRIEVHIGWIFLKIFISCALLNATKNTMQFYYPTTSNSILSPFLEFFAYPIGVLCFLFVIFKGSRALHFTHSSSYFIFLYMVISAAIASVCINIH